MNGSRATFPPHLLIMMLGMSKQIVKYCFKLSLRKKLQIIMIEKMSERLISIENVLSTLKSDNGCSPNSKEKSRIPPKLSVSVCVLNNTCLIMNLISRELSQLFTKLWKRISSLGLN